jgi:hypothetical protein
VNSAISGSKNDSKKDGKSFNTGEEPERAYLYGFIETIQ